MPPSTRTFRELVAPVPPVQAPFWQLSPLVQTLPSLQADPFALFGLEQIPVEGAHVPAVWH